MNRPGAAPQSMRSIPNNAFATQSANTRSSQPSSQSRLQNGKLGGGSGWGGFGAPVGGATPGASNPPSRTNTLSNFAQAIGGGSSSQAPLDLSTGAVGFDEADFGDDGRVDSTRPAVPNVWHKAHDSRNASLNWNNADGFDQSEFPSLSGGGPQTQSSNNMTQAWNSTALRQAQPPQQTPVQRPHAPPGTQREPANQQQPQPHQQDNTFQFGSNLDSQYDGQRSAASRSESNPAQQGLPDEFPPLGGALNGDSRHNRQGGLLQGSTFGGGLENNNFGTGRNGASVQVNGQSDRNLDMSVSENGFGGGALESLRSPSDIHQTPSMLQDGQREQAARQQTRNVSGSSQQQFPIRDGGFSASQQAPIGQSSAPQQTQQQGSNFGSQMIESPIAGQPQLQRRRLSEMTESERWGLPGLLAQLPGRGENPSSLVMGQDINTLGVDLESPEPLFPTFTTPFADMQSRPAIPDYNLPPAYSVNNVPPLHTRIGNFADETLFAIFYQFTRDVMQEVAAAELYSRDWRWHKELRQWMMKDSQMSQPQRISERSERGVYVFFDAANWRRERREFILNYDHLDQRHGPTQPPSVQ